VHMLAAASLTLPRALDLQIRTVLSGVADC